MEVRFCKLDKEMTKDIKKDEGSAKKSTNKAPAKPSAEKKTATKAQKSEKEKKAETAEKAKKTAAKSKTAEKPKTAKTEKAKTTKSEKIEKIEKDEKIEKVEKNKKAEAKDKQSEKQQEISAPKKAAMVAELISLGKKNGVLSYKDIMDKLQDIHMEPEQMEKVYEILESNGIEVVEDLDQELEEIQSN